MRKRDRLFKLRVEWPYGLLLTAFFSAFCSWDSAGIPIKMNA